MSRFFPQRKIDTLSSRDHIGPEDVPFLAKQHTAILVDPVGCRSHYLSGSEMAMGIDFGGVCWGKDLFCSSGAESGLAESIEEKGIQ